MSGCGPMQRGRPNEGCGRFYNLVAAIINLLHHHYVLQKSSFFNECKETLKANVYVLIGDSMEVICFLCKNFIRIILNAFFMLLYFTIEVKKMIFLAMNAFAKLKCLKHTAAVVSTFLTYLIPHIKVNYPM